MVKKLKQFFLKYKFLIISLIIFWMGAFVLLDDGRHVSFNLEPYPDALFYVVPAWNFASGNDFSMSFQDNGIKSLVTPLYSILLIPIYLLFQTPIAFYFLNILLLTGSIFFLWLFLKENTPNQRFLILIFSLLPIILWLPSLPMAENLLVFLITVTLWLWKTKKIGEKNKYILLALLQTLLFLTKRSAYSFILSFSAVLILENILNKKWKNIFLYSGFGAIFFFMQSALTSPEFIQQTVAPKEEQKSASGLVVFSFSYFLKNAWEYTKISLGIKNFFLWKKISFTIPGFLGLSALAEILNKKNIFWKKTLSYWLLIIGIIISQSFFYYVDARYVISIIPITIILFAIILKNSQKSLKKITLIILGTLLGIIFISHKDFYKTLIGSNWFNRSRAWQYEAVKNFENYTFEKDSKLITTIPPYLFSLYSKDYPQLYPLSQDQEFTNKSQQVWGRNLDYENLLKMYHKKSQNEKLYISNAYTTYSLEAREAFSQYQKEFKLELVFEGCEKTCNLYKLHQ